MNRIRFLVLVIWLCIVVPAGAAEFQARLLVSNRSPFVGEEMTVTLEVDRPNGQYGRLQPDWPPFEGFLAGEPWSSGARLSESAPEGHRIEYLHRTLRPLLPGRFALSVPIRAADGPDQAVASGELMVLPLPEHGRPGTFSPGAIGVPELILADQGDGRRIVELTLRGKFDLTGFPPPAIELPGGATISLLTDQADGQPPAERTRHLQYLYDPAGSSTSPSFSMAVFDPRSEEYRVLRAGAPTGNWSGWTACTFLLFIPLLSLWPFLRRRQMRRHRLAELLRPGHQPPRRARLEILAERGVPAETLSELEAFWKRHDAEKFGNGSKGGSNVPDPDLPRLVRSCATAIDKHASIHALSGRLFNFFRKGP